MIIYQYAMTWYVCTDLPVQTLEWHVADWIEPD